MILEIALTQSDTADADFTSDVSLDGVVFTLAFSYSERSSLWYLSVYLTTDGDPVPIWLGTPMVAGYPLLFGCTHESRPIGELGVDADFDPTQTDLGTFAKLVYYDAAELGRI